MQQAVMSGCAWLPRAFPVCCLSHVTLGQASGPKAWPGLHRCSQANIQGRSSCLAAATTAWQPTAIGFDLTLCTHPKSLAWLPQWLCAWPAPASDKLKLFEWQRNLLAAPHQSINTIKHLTEAQQLVARQLHVYLGTPGAKRLVHAASHLAICNDHLQTIPET